MSNQSALAAPDVAMPTLGAERTEPLSSLFRDPLNIRKKSASQKSVDELAALILAHGLLQNLIVRAERTGTRRRRTGRFGVVAGGRRLAALMLLAESGRIAPDFPVRVVEVSDEDAIATSLAENSGREELHGADLFEAFCAMIDQGRTVVEVANAWGLTVQTVTKHLRLARVSPKLLAMYREDALSLDQLIAYSITTDHATQEATFERTRNGNAWAIKNALTDEGVSAWEALARFVTVEAYEAAGGEVRRDLFSDDATVETTFLQDRALLERLAHEKLHEFAATLEGDSLAWVDTHLSFTFFERRAYIDCKRVKVKITPEQRERKAALLATIAEVEESITMLEEEEDGTTLWEHHAHLMDEVEDIDNSLHVIPAKFAEVAGSVVYLNTEGEPKVERALLRAPVRPAKATGKAVDADAEPDSAPDAGGTAPAPAAPTKRARAQFSEPLMQSMTSHRSAALRVQLARAPELALRVATARLAAQVFLPHDAAAAEPVKLTVSATTLGREEPGFDQTPAVVAFEALREQFGDRVPGTREEILPWVMRRELGEVLELFAFCTACSVNAVTRWSNRSELADELASVVDLDMADWWRPTPTSFLNSVSKSQVLQALAEAGKTAPGVDLAALKKGALVEHAAALLQDARWLPGPLRPASPELQADDEGASTAPADEQSEDSDE